MATAATSSATMAAAGFDKRASTASSLQTPGSGTFPSELLSPMTASPGFMKREDALKTPITPPSAYLDFLKNFSPAIQSPASTTSARFSFQDRSFDRSFDKSSDVKSSISPPTSQPPLSRNNSSDTHTTEQSTTSTTSNAAADSTLCRTSDSPRVIIPPSPFVKPGPRSARTPRRLHIPQSPFSPALGSAHSVHSVASPYSSTPLSAAPWSASFSPREHHADISGPSGKVHVRQVVTRTYTYCRTPLDPAPKGKRRKIEKDEAETSKASSEEPPIKQERVERIEEESATDSVASTIPSPASSATVSEV